MNYNLGVLIKIIQITSKIKLELNYRSQEFLQGESATPELFICSGNLNELGYI